MQHAELSRSQFATSIPWCRRRYRPYALSERNIDRMVAFYRAYPGLPTISPQPAAKLLPPDTFAPIVPQPAAQMMRAAGTSRKVQQLAAKIPWFHHVLLMEKIKDLPTRLWYMQQTVANGWRASK